MREIKFRAWDKIRHVMVDNVQTTYDDERADSFCDFLFEKLYEVMQYTGIKDNKGKEIYEGDILRECGLPAEVFWKNDAAAFYVRNTLHDFCQPLIYYVDPRDLHSPFLHIIGNIYENPEFMLMEEAMK